MHKETFQ